MQIKLRKWKWVVHTLKKDSSAIQEQALNSDLPGQGRRGRPRRIWRRKKEENAELVGKIWLKRWGETTIIYRNEFFGVPSWRPCATKWSNETDFILSIRRCHREVLYSTYVAPQHSLAAATSAYHQLLNALSVCISVPHVSHSSIQLECQPHRLSAYTSLAVRYSIGVQDCASQVWGSNLGLETLNDGIFVAQSEID